MEGSIATANEKYLVLPRFFACLWKTEGVDYINEYELGELIDLAQSIRAGH